MPIGRFGVFKPLDYVFLEDDAEIYRIDMQKNIAEGGRPRDADARFYKQFRTWQISDHHLKWAEFRIDW